MIDDSILGATLGQLGQTVKQTAKQVVKIPQEMAKDAGGQIGGAKKPAEGTEPKQENKPQSKWSSDEERVKFLRDLYGSPQVSPGSSTLEVDKEVDKPKEETKKATSANPLITTEQKPSEFEEQIKDESPEEQKKLMELRNQLHKENYYDPTFNPKNPPAGGEERPAEKVENEKKQETVDLQKKEEQKPPPLAVVREQNKAEAFRGAAG